MRSRSAPYALGALAALAALGFALQPLLGSREGKEPGAPAASGDLATVRGISPRGGIPRAPRTFVWSSDPVATAYRFELLGRHDLLLFEQVTAETTIDLPSGYVDWNIVAGARWRVTPIEGASERTASDLVTFRIVSP